MVMIRSSLLIKLESVFKRVVFSRTRTAGDNYVQAGLDATLQQHHHFGRKGLEIQQVFEFQRIRAEAANGNGGPIEGQRRNDRVDT